MTRLVRFIVRNWPLKVAAVFLATVLYSGLVLSQNARVWSGPIPIAVTGQPRDAFLLDRLPDVTLIRYLAPTDLATRLTNGDFRAEVDLSTVTPQSGGSQVRVPVRVWAPNPRITILGYEPQEVDVRLDPVTTRIVPVTVDRGTVPPGLVTGPPEADPSTVTIRGPSSVVRQVRSAVARVTIDPSAINVDADVPLFAVDELDQPVQPVDIEPQEAHVLIQVGRAEETRSVPVVPRFRGSLPVGYEVTRVEADPPVVTLSGDLGTLSRIDSVQTQPIDLTGRRADLEIDASLDLPDGVAAVGAGGIRVRLTIEAEQGSRSFGIGLILDGARPDLEYRVSVPDILVTLSGDVADLDIVDATRLTARLDVSGLGTGSHRVPVDVEAPSGLRVAALTPNAVTVTVSSPGATTLPNAGD
ncbi:MAG TPA: CdaR family protein [Candidatus Limnocylindrales bacterium]|nr:CdaR family protein [Candidatus Limnocylindrales bacterium]